MADTYATFQTYMNVGIGTVVPNTLASTFDIWMNVIIGDIRNKIFYEITPIAWGLPIFTGAYVRVAGDATYQLYENVT